MPRKEILDRTQKDTQPFRITKGESFQLKNYDPGDTCGLKLALRWAMRCTPIASVIVISAGSPSGIADTAMPTTIKDES